MATFWRCVSSATAFTALVGSLCVSRLISSILRPLTPPAVVDLLDRELDAAIDSDAGRGTRPVNAGRYPILIGSLAAIAGLATPAASDTAPTADPAKTWRRLIVMSFPPGKICVFYSLSHPQPYSRRATMVKCGPGRRPWAYVYCTNSSASPFIPRMVPINSLVAAARRVSSVPRSTNETLIFPLRKPG